ncbi:MAG: hypothetical protein WCX32_03130 [Clostridia bacterium]|jgi:hypothetical protein|nr:hypothetical protein [Clostridia bacterium]MDD4275766.1 hypothetical protein [Clostridia bacterium]
MVYFSLENKLWKIFLSMDCEFTCNELQTVLAKNSINLSNRLLKNILFLYCNMQYLSYDNKKFVKNFVILNNYSNKETKAIIKFAISNKNHNFSLNDLKNELDCNNVNYTTPVLHKIIGFLMRERFIKIIEENVFVKADLLDRYEHTR